MIIPHILCDTHYKKKMEDYENMIIKSQYFRMVDIGYLKKNPYSCSKKENDANVSIFSIFIFIQTHTRKTKHFEKNRIQNHTVIYLIRVFAYIKLNIYYITLYNEKKIADEIFTSFCKKDILNAYLPLKE